MDVTKYRAQLTDSVVSPMLDYLGECGEDCGYTEKQVRKCEEILAQYLDGLAALTAPSDKAIMSCVKKAVLALNKLNEKTDYALLETEERENIWELIQNSAVECGLTDPEDDITEEWREW